jgi:type IV secretory pathway TrbD component
MNTHDQPREIAIHPSANRPHLVLGGDRELVFCAALLAAVLAFAVSTWWSFALAIVLWLTSVAVLARMGKADPLLRHVYLKHVRSAAFYPAKSGIHSQGCWTPKNWR